MTKDDKEIVSVLRKRLADKVGQDRFDLWFNTGVEIATEGQTLLILGSHSFTLERLHKAFRTELESVASDLFGPEAAVQFRITNKAAEQPLRERAAQPVAPAALVPPTPTVAASPAPNYDRPRRKLASLDTFVVSDSSRLAHAAAKAVEPRLGLMSPLFLHGPTGCGKTHLLEGICAAVRKHGRERRVVSLSAEQFTSYFLEALQGSGLPSFRRKYRDVDLLIIDDVQFFAGKKATLVELQHTIDTIARAGKQMVLAADRPPTELACLGAELSARMAGGLVCGLETLDETTRLAVLAQNAARLSIELPQEVLRFLAAQLPGDGRQLTGALNRIAAMSEAYQLPVTLELATKATHDLLQTSRRSVQLIDIERAVCNVFGIAPELLHAKKRTKQVSMPRMLAMWLARKYTRSALTEIGDYFGQRSHSTVIAAQNNVERWRSGGEAMQLAHGECGVDDAIRRLVTELRVG